MHVDRSGPTRVANATAARSGDGVVRDQRTLGRRRIGADRSGVGADDALLLIVEPGTPRGFGAIAAARRRLLAVGAHPVGPCTHAATCPLDGASPAGAPGWCHQSVRLPRTRIHRAAKGADLGWEDEPFSWLMLSRDPVAVRGSRVLAPPRVHKGAVELQLCTANGFAATSVRRNDRVAYKTASDLEWGDRFDPGTAELHSA